MIRKAITMLLWLMCFAIARAETHYKPHISVGAHGGIGLSEVSFSPSVKQAWENGLCGGLSVRYAEEKLVGILAEVNYVQRGWSEKFEDSPLQYSRSLSYVEVPIMTHIYFGPNRFKCFFNLGPEFCYMLSESITSNFDYHNPESVEGWPTDSRMTEQLVENVKNKFDYGICAGFGCEFYMTPRRSIYIEGRYYFGLGNIFPAAKADTFSASRNMTITVTLGYNFRIK